MQDGFTPPDGIAPCHQCGGSGFAWHRDRLLFWLCIVLFWPAAFFVPKKPCCIRCRMERWDAVRGSDGPKVVTPPSIPRGCLVTAGIVFASVLVALLAGSLLVGFIA